MSEAKCPECDLAQHRGDCFDDEIDARLSKSLRAEGERLRAHGGGSITYVERCDSCETFRQRMIAEKARAEKAEAEVERLRVVGYEIIASRIENIKEREAEKARAEKLKDAGEMLWVVVANVSGGNWKLQSQEWQDAAAKWRDNYFAIAARALAGEEGE